MQWHFGAQFTHRECSYSGQLRSNQLNKSILQIEWPLTSFPFRIHANITDTLSTDVLLSHSHSPDKSSLCRALLQPYVRSLMEHFFVVECSGCEVTICMTGPKITLCDCQDKPFHLPPIAAVVPRNPFPDIQIREETTSFNGMFFHQYVIYSGM